MNVASSPALARFFDSLLDKGIDEKSAAFLTGNLSREALEIVLSYCKKEFTKDEWTAIQALPPQTIMPELEKQYFAKKNVQLSDVFDYTANSLVEKFERA